MKVVTPSRSTEYGLNKTKIDDKRVHRAQIKALYVTLQVGALSSMALAWVTALTFYFVLQDRWALIWLALHSVNTLGVRYVASRRNDPNAYVRSHFWERRYLNNIIRYSLVWALAPWLFMPSNNLAMAVLLMAAMFGLCTAGMLSVAWNKAAIWGLCLPMTVGLALCLGARSDQFGPFLAFIVMLYLCVVLLLGHRLNAHLVRLLTIRFRNEDLTSELASQVTNAEQANHEKSRFLAAASHDLRQPLHAIALFGAALERGTKQYPSEHAHATNLLKAVESMSQSLNAMLDISRIDAGVLSLSNEPVHLNALLVELDRSFGSVAAAKSLQLRLRASNLWVMTDRDSLRRILSNLIDNALKYTTKGGVVVLARPRGDRVWLDIRDTGIGIPAHEVEHIFNEFYQVDNQGRDRTHGMGVGLSVVRRLATLLEHEVQVLSHPGRGSCFRVVVPIALPGQSATIKPPADTRDPPVPNNLPQRVLMMEDEMVVGNAATALLSSYGVELHVVRSEEAADEALTRASAAGLPYQVLVCDYRLAGGIDGLEAGLSLRQRTHPQPALLLITGETAPDRLKRVHERGVPVLFKPVSAPVLLRALAQLNQPQGLASAPLTKSELLRDDLDI